MKKLLVVLMVLSIATVANAGLVIGVGGVNPADSEVTLLPSQEAIISIIATQEMSPVTAYLFVTEGAMGTVSGGSVVWSDYSQSLGEFNLYQNPGVDDPDYVSAVQYYGFAGVTQTYFMNIVGATVPALAVDGTMVDGIVFHCAAPGDATIILGNVVDYGAGGYMMQIIDTQVIHQIPEPMTLGLLGLGGLFLRRRK